MKNIKHIPAYFKRTIIIVAFFFITGNIVNAGFTETVSVKVQQDESKLTVSVRSQKIGAIQFYMFTINGSLVKQLKLQGSSKFSIAHLSKGVYLYDLFSNDERLKSGRIELK